MSGEDKPIIVVPDVGFIFQVNPLISKIQRPKCQMQAIVISLCYALVPTLDAETPQIAVGSKVLLRSNVIKPGQSATFHKLWGVPYLVTSNTYDGLLYTLRHCTTGKSLRSDVHANRVKLFDAVRDAFYSQYNVIPRDVLRTTTPNRQERSVTIGVQLRVP